MLTYESGHDYHNREYELTDLEYEVNFMRTATCEIVFYLLF